MEDGDVAEWLKAHDSKSCGPKGLGGSNPFISAKPWWALFFAKKCYNISNYSEIPPKGGVFIG